MKLLVKDIAWGIDRKTGTKSEKEVASELFELLEPQTLKVGVVKKEIVVMEIKEDSVLLRLNKQGKTVELKVGEKYTHAPMSFDGGHNYILEVLK
jgi:hypothetical protein